MKNNGFVYHASSEQNLKEIIPSVSTHHQSWVYASKDIVVASTFLNNWGGDFCCSIGRDYYSKKIYICERQPGGFEKRYRTTAAAIYTLNDKSFKNHSECWIEEVVSSESILPVSELKIENVRQFLEELNQESRLKIIRYPNKVSLIPKDDSDLIRKALKWTYEIGEPFMEHLEQVNPLILSKVTAMINNTSKEMM